MKQFTKLSLFQLHKLSSSLAYICSGMNMPQDLQHLVLFLHSSFPLPVVDFRHCLGHQPQTDSAQAVVVCAMLVLGSF